MVRTFEAVRPRRVEHRPHGRHRGERIGGRIDVFTRQDAGGSGGVEGVHAVRVPCREADVVERGELLADGDSVERAVFGERTHRPGEAAAGELNSGDEGRCDCTESWGDDSEC